MSQDIVKSAANCFYRLATTSQSIVDQLGTMRDMQEGRIKGSDYAPVNPKWLVEELTRLHIGLRDTIRVETERMQALQLEAQADEH